MVKALTIAASSVVVVLVVVVGFIVIKSLANPSDASTANSGTGGAVTAASVTSQIASVPAATLDTVGAGPAYPATGSVYPHAVQTIKPAGAPLTASGKPQVVYVGAEYCPFCAAERWPLVTALSRFGTFTNLGATHSATNDVYPNTPTFSFKNAKFASKYLALQTVELYGNRPVNGQYPPLQKPTAQQNALIQKYDPKGTIPFIYMGSYLQTDASYNPQILAGMSMQQVAQAMRDTNTDQSIAILGTANQITAALCAQTGGQPANVCSTPGVTAAAAHLPK